MNPTPGLGLMDVNRSLDPARHWPTRVVRWSGPVRRDLRPPQPPAPVAPVTPGPAASALPAPAGKVGAVVGAPVPAQPPAPPPGDPAADPAAAPPAPPPGPPGAPPGAPPGPPPAGDPAAAAPPPPPAPAGGVDPMTGQPQVSQLPVPEPAQPPRPKSSRDALREAVLLALTEQRARAADGPSAELGTDLVGLGGLGDGKTAALADLWRGIAAGPAKTAAGLPYRQVVDLGRRAVGGLGRAVGAAPAAAAPAATSALSAAERAPLSLRGLAGPGGAGLGHSAVGFAGGGLAGEHAGLPGSVDGADGRFSLTGGLLGAAAFNPRLARRAVYSAARWAPGALRPGEALPAVTAPLRAARGGVMGGLAGEGLDQGAAGLGYDTGHGFARAGVALGGAGGATAGLYRAGAAAGRLPAWLGQAAGVPGRAARQMYDAGMAPVLSAGRGLARAGEFAAGLPVGGSRLSAGADRLLAGPVTGTARGVLGPLREALAANPNSPALTAARRLSLAVPAAGGLAYGGAAAADAAQGWARQKANDLVSGAVDAKAPEVVDALQAVGPHLARQAVREGVLPEVDAYRQAVEGHYAGRLGLAGPGGGLDPGLLPGLGGRLAGAYAGRQADRLIGLLGLDPAGLTGGQKARLLGGLGLGGLGLVTANPLLAGGGALLGGSGLLGGRRDYDVGPGWPGEEGL